MAYIANQDEEENEAQNVATNIFQTNTAQQQANATPVQAGAPPSGDQSTAISSGGGAAGGQKAPLNMDSASSSKEVIRRNAGKMASPIDIGQTRQGISQAKTDLQNEANSYVANQKNNVGALDDNVIKKAVEVGDEGELGKVRQRLTQAPQYKNFTQTTNTDYSSKINDLSDTNLRNYFKMQGGPRATSGEAAFDALLLNKNKQFKQDRAAAQLDAANLDRDVKEIRGKVDTNAKAAYDQAFGAETNRIKDSIRSQVSPVVQRAEEQAAAEMARRQEMAKKDPKSLLQNLPGYQAWLTDIAEKVGDSGDEDRFLSQRVSQGLGNNPVGMNFTDFPKYNFVDFNQTPVSASNYLDENQVGMIQRGRGLLGEGGPMYSAAGPVGDPYSFNEDAARAFLAEQASKYRADLEAQAARERDKASKPPAKKDKPKVVANDLPNRGEDYTTESAGSGWQNTVKGAAEDAAEEVSSWW